MNTHSILSRTTALVTAASVLAGCTLVSTKNEEQEIVRKADQYMNVQPPPANRELVAFTPARYFGSRVIRSSHGDPLPKAIEALRLTIRRSNPISLDEFSQALSQSVGNLPIRVDGRSGANGGATAQSDATASALLAHANAASGLVQTASGAAGVGAVVPFPQDEDFTPDFRDAPLETILDALSERFDCDWSFTGGAIVINRLVTRVFEVRADPSQRRRLALKMLSSASSQALRLTGIIPTQAIRSPWASIQGLPVTEARDRRMFVPRRWPCRCCTEECAEQRTDRHGAQHNLVFEFAA